MTLQTRTRTASVQGSLGPMIHSVQKKTGEKGLILWCHRGGPRSLEKPERERTRAGAETDGLDDAGEGINQYWAPRASSPPTGPGKLGEVRTNVPPQRQRSDGAEPSTIPSGLGPPPASPRRT